MEAIKRAISQLGKVACSKGAFDRDKRVINAAINLEFASDDWTSLDQAKNETSEALKIIGPPGDWGYGSEEGKALVGVLNAFKAAEPKAEPVGAA